MNRAAFQEMFLRGQVSRQFKPSRSEAKNLSAITAELVGKIEEIAKQQAAGAKERAA
jgi:hypothetical protein